MKKLLLILIVAALGVGSGMYLAQKTDTIPFKNMLMPQDQKPWKVTHPNWTGSFIPEENNRMYLDSNGDYATILSNENGILTVKWDNWGTEKFQCDAQRNCTLIK